MLLARTAGSPHDPKARVTAGALLILAAQVVTSLVLAVPFLIMAVLFGQRQRPEVRKAP